ncbi:MAG: hypothetical protein LBH96_04280 [Candidatus Peribacteria bacterium]|jgi:dihydrofolate reductase|nr:hypothetical protein [Candidatus Peribacteria bacterium]
MKATLFMATSLDGFITTQEGDEDFLPPESWAECLKLVEKFGHIIWGRKTYESVASWGDDSLRDVEQYPIIVVSQQQISFTQSNVTVCSSPKAALALVRQW